MNGLKGFSRRPCRPPEGPTGPRRCRRTDATRYLQGFPHLSPERQVFDLLQSFSTSPGSPAQGLDLLPHSVLHDGRHACLSQQVRQPSIAKKSLPCPPLPSSLGLLDYSIILFLSFNSLPRARRRAAAGGPPRFTMQVSGDTAAVQLHRGLLEPLLPESDRQAAVLLPVAVRGPGPTRSGPLRLRMRRPSPALLTHSRSTWGVVDDHARPQQVGMVGRRSLIARKKSDSRASERVLSLMLVHREVDEHAGLDVPVLVDVQVATPRGQAPLPPEARRTRNRRSRPSSPAQVIYAFEAQDALFGCGHELEGRPRPDGHVLEVPADEAPLLVHVVIQRTRPR